MRHNFIVAFHVYGKKDIRGHGDQPQDSEWWLTLPAEQQDAVIDFISGGRLDLSDDKLVALAIEYIEWNLDNIGKIRSEEQRALEQSQGLATLVTETARVFERAQLRLEALLNNPEKKPD